MEQTCSISGKVHDEKEGILWEDLRPSLQHFFKSQNLQLKPGAFISFNALNDLIRAYINKLSTEELRAHSSLVQRVHQQYKNDETLKPIKARLEEGPTTFGQRMADRIADFGGSWTFILIFFGFILIWMAINTFYFFNKGFDPYPYILLNLILSCLAALQAPVIMMSQNRQEDKDRERAEYDFKVNLKAETEIRLLHEKLDYILLHQNQSLVELFQLHLDILQQMQHRIESLKNQ
jgi:uncharacterized membrane protein